MRSPTRETLVARIVRESIRANRKPMGANALAELDASVPESLQTWLAFDTQSPNGEVSLVEDDGLELRARSMKELLEELVVSESAGEDWEEDTREAMSDLAVQLPGEALLLRAPCGQDHFLYLGTRSRRGECAVLVLEDEEITVGWSGFDVYVGELLGGITANAPEELQARAVMTKLLFG